MEKNARIVSLQKPEKTFWVGSKDILIGRSKDCNICIPEKYVSRRHARIFFENSYHVIEKVGINPIIVNSKIAEKHFLKDGDHITFGNKEYVYHVEETQPAAFQEQVFEQHTVVRPSSPIKKILPGVVIVSPDGQSNKYDITKKNMFIGRALDSDIRIDDPSVSRKHCVIRLTNDGYLLENLSESAPITSNNKLVKQRVLRPGDQFKMGSCLLSFFSDQSKVHRNKAEIPYTERKGKGSRLFVWPAVTGLLIISISSALYFLLYIPWKEANALKTVSAYIEDSNFEDARIKLSRFLDSDTARLESDNDRELLSWAAISIAQAMIKENNLTGAKIFLNKYLDIYGSDEKSDEVRAILDECRLKLGQRFENSRKIRKAKQEFSAIKKKSPYFNQAQQAIKRLQQHYQKPPQEVKRVPEKNIQNTKSDQATSQLLEQANKLFKEQKLLDPPNRYAYDIYQTVLSLDPTNAIALKRIRTIKETFRESANHSFQNHEFEDALDIYERYLTTDPQNSLVKRRIAECRQKIEESRQATHQLQQNYQRSTHEVNSLSENNQQYAKNSQAINQLLEQANEHFQEFRYFEPPKQYAYDIYQTVLSRDPTNAIALSRTEKIKVTFRESANHYFKKGDFSTALELYERYLLMDPQHPLVKERIAGCRQKLNINTYQPNN